MQVSWGVDRGGGTAGYACIAILKNSSKKREMRRDKNERNKSKKLIASEADDIRHVTR